MVSSSSLSLHAPTTDRVYFPLASNAHALMTGASLASVRARLKTSSLLHGQVLIESGTMDIRAGPSGSKTRRAQIQPNEDPRWQTPTRRSRAQQARISLAISLETVPGVPAQSPYHQLLSSETSICWMPTFEPFRDELPKGCDWVSFGIPSAATSRVTELVDRRKRLDEKNQALLRLVPEGFVRSLLIEHVATDLAIGSTGEWDVSVDRLHGQVIDAHLAGDALVERKGFALPILVPRVDDLEWEDVRRIRGLKAISRLREVLREVETEAYELAASGDDVEVGVRSAYERKVRHASEGVEGIRSIGSMALAELVVGFGVSYGISGLTLLGPVSGLLAASGLTATVMTGLHVRRVRQNRSQRAWLGVMDAITEAAH